MSYNAAVWLLDRHGDEGRGDRAAIRHRGVTLDYATVLAEAWRAQRALGYLGVGSGDRVAMVVNDEPAFVSWFLGGLRAGVVPVPLSTMLTGGELGSIVADAEASTLVVSATHADRIASVAAAAPTVSNVVVLDPPPGAGTVPDAGVLPGEVVPTIHAWADFDDRAEVAPADTDADTPAFWLYSSGTTGLPKGVVHRHASLQATADTYARSVLGADGDDRFLSVAKLFFAYGLGNSLTFPFSVGATTVLDDRPPTPTSVIDLVAAEAPTLFFASPGFVAGLLDAGVAAAAFASVRATVTAGESLPADLQRRFAQLTGRPVLDGIGSTEALHIFISNTVSDQQPGSSGRPVPGYEVELRDDDGAVITGADTPGKLWVRGPSTATGYWRRPEVTAETFRDGWVRTGDVYVRSADGYWTFLGRNNDMIKAGGIWVSPAEVESVLIEHPSVREAAVVGTRDAAGLETAVAFVVAASGAAVDAAELEAHCRDRMAAFKRPRRVIVVDELPRTATGKVRRFALRDRLNGAG